MSRTWVVLLGIFALALLATSAPDALAVKPDKPPKPPPAPGPPGTIYYGYPCCMPDRAGWNTYGLNTMDADGNQKTPLQDPDTGDYWLFGSDTPSEALHAGERWHLEWRTVSGTYPDGRDCKEVFAVREDLAVAVQLTDDPDLDGTGRPPLWVRSTSGGLDAAISWSARRWEDQDGDGDKEVVGGGVYKVDLTYDADGNVAGLASVPGEPVMAFDLVDLACEGCYWHGSPTPDVEDFSWSPDGVRFAYMGYGSNALPPGPTGIHIADTGTQTTAFLVAGVFPRWSPDGSRIGFDDGRDLKTIGTDGTGETTVARENPNTTLCCLQWAPTGDHVVYRKGNRRELGTSLHVYRADADGSQAVDLTDDLPYSALPVAWRE